MTSAYRVSFSSEAQRSLARLPEKVALAIAEFIVGPLAREPLRLSKPLRNELSGSRPARRGDYRVLFDVDQEKHVILVIRIAHRADVYR
ncbi:MAG: mRNA interferase RelE/StbE [Frankiales bacterium]|nr:mRNA interferase RelE/StbE [Frankiales bacterium]